jgi:hypothetical protein
MDGKISTAGSFRAMYRQYRRAHTLPFFSAGRRPRARLQTKINCGLRLAG